MMTRTQIINRMKMAREMMNTVPSIDPDTGVQGNSRIFCKFYHYSSISMSLLFIQGQASDC